MSLPGIQITNQGRIVTTMIRSPLTPEWHPLHGGWSIYAPPSAKSRASYERAELGGPTGEKRARMMDLARRRRGSGNLGRDEGQVVYLIDDQPVRIPSALSDAELKHWNERLSRVRVRFELPGLPPFRAEKLWPVLDRLWAEGIHQIDGHALRNVV